jgi:hypothetical protein
MLHRKNIFVNKYPRQSREGRRLAFDSGSAGNGGGW